MNYCSEGGGGVLNEVRLGYNIIWTSRNFRDGPFIFGGVARQRKYKKVKNQETRSLKTTAKLIVTTCIAFS